MIYGSVFVLLAVVCATGGKAELGLVNAIIAHAYITRTHKETRA